MLTARIDMEGGGPGVRDEGAPRCHVCSRSTHAAGGRTCQSRARRNPRKDLGVARSRGFDTDAAVERAMGLFWKQGYRATPMPRLTELLGIGSGSLYAAFGSKDGLYAQALRRYCEGLVA